LALPKYGAVAVVRPDINAKVGSVSITVVINTDGPREVLNARFIRFATLFFCEVVTFANPDEISLSNDRASPLTSEALRFALGPTICAPRAKSNHARFACTSMKLAIRPHETGEAAT
jgi:hypothetical protein